MLPGLTRGLLGGAALIAGGPTYGVDANTVSLMKFDGVTNMSGAGSGLVDYAKPSRIWQNMSSGNSLIGVAAYGGTSVDNDGSRIQTPDDPDFNFTGDFTIDFWAQPEGVAAGNNGYILTKANAAGFSPFLFFQDSTVGVAFYASSNGTAWDVASNKSCGGMAMSQWHHYAVTRQGNNWATWRDGVLQTSWTTALVPFVNTQPVSVGGSPAAANPWGGYIDELRFSKVCRYTANFTPQWFPYFPALNGQNDAATRLLLHAENFSDSAFGPGNRSGHPMFPNGTVRYTGETFKFGTRSFKFDGSTNCGLYVQAPSHYDFHPQNGDWTIDFWYYRWGGAGLVAGTRTNSGQFSSWSIYDTGTNFALYGSIGGTSWDAWNNVNLGTIPSSQWVHFALVHSNDLPDASAMRAYVNGVQSFAGNYTKGVRLATSTNGFGIGGPTDVASGQFYIDEIRYSTVARWIANFTPPTQPYGPDPEPTALLLHFDGTNGSNVFTDASPQTHGNADIGGAPVVSTAQSKFGGASLSLDGTSAFINMRFQPDWEFGAGDFTIDWWERRTAATDACAAILRSPTAGYQAFMLGYGASSNLGCYLSSTGSSWDISNGQTLGSLEVNVWHHFAVVRSGTLFLGFKDGVIQSVWNSSLPLINDTAALSIGRTFGTNYYPGFLDEIRVSKGIARWVDNFTPPAAAYTGTEALPVFGTNGNDQYTKILLHFNGQPGNPLWADVNRGGSGHTWGGGASLSTTQTKFGNTSAFFNGSNAMSTPTHGDFTISAGDFTVDCWFFIAGGAGTRRFIWGHCDSTAAATAISTICEIQADNTLRASACVGGASNFINGGTPSTGVWHHLAFVRTGGSVIRLFLDGVQVGGDAACTGNINAGSGIFAVGALGAYPSGLLFNGYIDEFRFSSQIARWTANFTPPAAPYS